MPESSDSGFLEARMLKVLWKELIPNPNGEQLPVHLNYSQHTGNVAAAQVKICHFLPDYC